MEASITLDNGDRLQVKPEQYVLRLTPGIGGAQIELNLQIARHVATSQGSPPAKEDSPVFCDDERLRITGTLLVSAKNPQQDRRYLCLIENQHLVAAVPTMTGFRMSG